MAIQTTTFKGARYIVKFHDPIQWSATESYEAIEAVQYNAYTYISKQPVPVGVQIDNEAFWLLWADPNAQMEQLRQLVDEYQDQVEALSDAVDSFAAIIPAADFSAANTVKKYIDLDISKAHVFDTVAAMKAANTLSVGAICHTLGFHAKEDGGSAWYEISDTGTADEMSVISCGNLFAKLIINEPFVTPEMFGAYGDGIHDDTASISECAKNSKIIKCSNKTYAICHANISNAAGIEIIGNGCTFKNFKTDFSDEGSGSGTVYSTAILFYALSGSKAIKFSDCTLDENCQNVTDLPTSVTGLSYCSCMFDLADDLVLENVKVKNTIFTAFLVNNGGNIFMNNCKCTDISYSAITPEGSSRNVFETRSKVTQNKVFISNSVFDKVHDMVGRFDDARYVLISNCYVTNTNSLIERHVNNYSYDLFESHVDNCFIDGCKNICGITTTSLQKSHSYITNSIIKNVTGILFGMSGYNNELNINNCNIHVKESASDYGLTSLAGTNSVCTFENCTIDMTEITRQAHVFSLTGGTGVSCKLINCNVAFPSGTSYSITRNWSSASAPVMQIEGCSISGLVGTVVADSLIFRNNNLIFDTGYVLTVGDIKSIIIESNKFEYTGSSTASLAFLQMGIDTPAICEVYKVVNNMMIDITLRTGTNKLSAGSKITDIHGNFFHMTNSQAITIPAGSLASIYDNNAFGTFSGTVQIQHDNVGVTIS